MKNEEAFVRLSLLRDTLLAVHRQLVIPQDTETLIQKICSVFVEEQGYKSAWMILLDEKQRCMLTGSAGLLLDFSLLQQQLDQNQFPPCIKQVLEKQNLIYHTSRKPLCPGCVMANGYPDTGIMVAPLEYNQRIYGVLAVSLDKELTLDDKERELLEKIAKDIAFVLFNRQSEAARALIERQLTIRDKISRTFIIHHDNDLFGGVLEIVLEAMDSNLGIFGYLDETGMLICPSMSTSVWEQCKMVDKTICFPQEKWAGIWKEALQTGITQCVNSPFAVPEGHVPIDNSLATAIVSGGKVIGLLQVANKNDGYGKEDQRLLESMATTIAPILQARLAQQHTEQKLKNALNEYTNLYNNVPDMLVSVDASSRKVIACNQALIDKTGYSRDEIIGHPTRDFYHPDYREEGENEIIPAWLKTGEEVAREIILLRKDGSSLPVSIAISVVRDDDNNIIHSSTVMRDITERKKMEEQLLISEKMRTIAGLAAGIAHEINTPLSGILQSIQLVEMGFDANTEQNKKDADSCGIDLLKVQKYFKKRNLDYFLAGIRDAATTAADIIADLLQFSRPQERDLQRVDLTELIDHSIELAKTDYSLKKEYNILNVEFIRQDSPDRLVIYCVAMEIEQVLINLIKNSCQAMAEKDNTVKSHIIFRTELRNNRAVIEVEDNGPGMEKQTRLHAFDPFFTTKGVGKGTGLGLSVSYTIISDKHGGSICIADTSQDGTIFTIELPTESTHRGE